MKQKELSMSKTKKADQAEEKDINEAQDQKPDQPVDSELQNIIEAALFASREPLGIRKIMSLFPEDAKPSKVDIQNVILSLEEGCEFRGIELRRIGKGWRYQTKEKYSSWLRKLNAQKPPRYSRALLETMAIIAYRQPVTRGDIEEIRGVGVSSDTILTLPRDGVRSEAETDQANQQAAAAGQENNTDSAEIINLHPKKSGEEVNSNAESVVDENLTENGGSDEEPINDAEDVSVDDDLNTQDQSTDE